MGLVRSVVPQALKNKVMEANKDNKQELILFENDHYRLVYDAENQVYHRYDKVFDRYEILNEMGLKFMLTNILLSLATK